MTLKSIQEFLNIDVREHYQKRRNILNQAGIMAGARVLGIAFGAIGAIWGMRCLGPQNLGISGMVQSIMTQASLVLGVISTTVLVREYKYAASNKARNQLVRVSNSFNLLGACVFGAVGLAVMAFHLAPSEYHFAGWFFAPLLLFNVLQPAWVFQAAEKQHFQSSIAVLQSALTALLYVSLFRPGMSAGADLAVLITVSVVLTAVYWWAIYRLTPMKGFLFDFGLLREAWKLIVRSRWLFFSSLAVYIYTAFEQPLLGWMYSLDELGKYRTAVKVTDVAVSFFNIVPIILYPRFLEWRKRGEELLWRRQWKMALLIAVLGGGASLFGFLLIPYFYPIVFGKAFAAAAIPCAILITSKIVAMITGLFYWGLMTDSKYDKQASIPQFLTVVFSVTANVIFIPRQGMMAASVVHFSSEALILVACIWVAYRRIHKIRAA